MSFKLISISITVATLIACGTSTPYKHHEKQRNPSDIKISSLDLATNQIQLRFEYRTYIEKTLESISCDIEFNSNISFQIIQQKNIKLWAFSTEIFNFNSAKINPSNKLNHLKSIDYTIDCHLVYDKGTEIISGNSVLHLEPSTQLKYR